MGPKVGWRLRRYGCDEFCFEETHRGIRPGEKLCYVFPTHCPERGFASHRQSWNAGGRTLPYREFKGLICKGSRGLRVPVDSSFIGKENPLAAASLFPRRL